MAASVLYDELVADWKQKNYIKILKFHWVSRALPFGFVMKSHR